MFDFIRQIEFRHPWLLLLALLAIAVYLLARRARGSVVFSSLDALPAEGATWRTRLSWVPDLLLALAVVATSVAAAGPRIPNQESRVRREGIAIMMVVDISSSMEALDMSTEDEERNRLQAAMDVFETFVLGSDDLRGRPDDAIGVVSFAGYADTRSPLTLDHSNLATVARSLQLARGSEDGTALGDGLTLAVERLRQSQARSRVAILLTDGVNNRGEESPLAAAELARTQGVRVYTIGVGSSGVAARRVRNMLGQQVLQPTAVDIDEETLEAIAERTDGLYFRATDAARLEEIYEQIDQLERTEIVEERFLNHDEYYDLSLAFGLLLACLAWLGRGTVLRRLP